jgi:hypothetical protein
MAVGLGNWVVGWRELAMLTVRWMHWIEESRLFVSPRFN